MTTVWVFHGEGGRFASAVFRERTRAEAWIRERGLSGVLTAYPVGEGVYDWAVDAGHFTPTKDKHRTPTFIGRFTSASQEHVHFTDGVPG